MADWISSTLIFVRDVEAAIAFYAGPLKFTVNMRYQEEGRTRMAGISRGDGCALLLTDQWPDKVGHAVIYTAIPAAELAALEADLRAQGIAIDEGFWGKELVVLSDPDGNQLWFPRD